MPKGRIEHANLTVSDPDRSAKLLQDLCGWRERWRGESMLGSWTIHVGDETGYVSLYSGHHAASAPSPAPAPAPAGQRRYAKGQPLNHVGFVVDDLEAAQAVVWEAGLEPFGLDDYEPGRRFYFFDWDGIEFELVCYE